MRRKEIKNIPAGSYWVGARSPLRLEAFLGTCVGVAAYDPEARVGGLIHLLLPEPPVAGNALLSEKYATTGLPLFMAALQAEGAVAGRMQACLAGGALIGPIAAQDINLDIGGRTCEKAVAFLNREGVAIDQFETGGFLPIQMGLDMDRGRVSIAPLQDAGYPADDTRLPVPTEADIRTAMQDLQPIPQVALRILRMVADEDYRVSELAGLVRQDQVICARTLRLCNAASFARRGRIETPEHALVFLGRDRFVQSVIAVCVQGFFSQQGRGYSLQMGGMYQHAVGTARVAEVLARRIRGLMPAMAYTAGLLHDIGKVVLDQFVASRRPLFYRDLAAEGDFLAAEEHLLGIVHTEAGRRLACDWGLPAPFVETIANHHHPERAGHNADLAHIVHIADLIMACFQAGLELESIDSARLAERLAQLGLKPADLQTLIDDMPLGVFNPAIEGLTPV